MTAINNTDIFFDDFAILIDLIGLNEITVSSRNTDCDCISYNQTSDDGDFDTSKGPGASPTTY